MTNEVGRREFVGLAIGAAAYSLPSAHAQQSGPKPKIAVLMGLANDSETQARAKVFEERLQEEGWTPGSDLLLEYRFAAGDRNLMQTYAREIVELRPDVIVGHSTPVVTALVQATRSIPIVFVVVSDPVGSGFVASMARPGGNVTGFTNLQLTIAGKYLTTLRELVPHVARVALMYNPDSAPTASKYYLDPFVSSAAQLKVQPITAEVRDTDAIESTIADLGSRPGGGLIVMPDNFLTLHRGVIISLAARYKVPTIYPYRYFADAGGLLSYGVDVLDLFRRAPGYVSRILRGAKPEDLPVQAPTKFELAINLKTVKSLGLAVPRILLAGANALIE